MFSCVFATIPYNGECGSRGGGAGGPVPPGKTQVKWVSIGNKQLDPPENVGPPLEPLKMTDFFEINHLTSV